MVFLAHVLDLVGDYPREISYDLVAAVQHGARILSRDHDTRGVSIDCLVTSEQIDVFRLLIYLTVLSVGENLDG